MCPSVVGGLPAAEILTTREDTATVVYALDNTLMLIVLRSDFEYGNMIRKTTAKPLTLS